MHTEAENIILP
jgi:hypothetical protein